MDFEKVILCTQLAETIHDFALSLNGKQTDVIFMNFKKAFHKVSHKKLLSHKKARGGERVRGQGGASSMPEVSFAQNNVDIYEL